MFIGREKELKSLNEVIRNKRAIFYTATKVGRERNLELFTRQVLEILEPDLQERGFATIEDLFDFISKKLTGEIYTKLFL